jgi:hypothetical protein
VSTGVRILPVAATIALGSVVGARLAERIGTRVIVVVGLVMFGTAIAWISISPIQMPYLQIALQMMLMGTGLGLTTAPATESILSVLPAAKAGVGSAVNDATREAGGTLGVAVIGSIFTSIYARHLADTSMAALPHDAVRAARDSVGAAFNIAAHASPSLSSQLVNASFMSGLHVGSLVAPASAGWAHSARWPCPDVPPGRAATPRCPTPTGHSLLTKHWPLPRQTAAAASEHCLNTWRKPCREVFGSNREHTAGRDW